MLIDKLIRIGALQSNNEYSWLLNNGLEEVVLRAIRDAKEASQIDSQDSTSGDEILFSQLDSSILWSIIYSLKKTSESESSVAILENIAINLSHLELANRKLADLRHDLAAMMIALDSGFLRQYILMGLVEPRKNPSPELVLAMSKTNKTELLVSWFSFFQQQRQEITTLFSQIRVFPDEDANAVKTDEDHSYKEELAIILQTISSYTTAKLEELDQLQSHLANLVSDLLLFCEEALTQLKTPDSELKTNCDFSCEDFAGNFEKRLTLVIRDLRRIKNFLEMISFVDYIKGDESVTLLKVRVAKVVEEVVADYQIYAEEKEVQIVLDNRDGTSLVAMANEMELVRTIANLVTNAIKYSDPEKANRLVTVIVEEQFGVFNGISVPGVKVIIKDNGIGISDSGLKNIFQRGFRDELAVKLAPGFGYGLSIAKNNVNRLGGEIDVNSILGQGTTFSLWLPIVPN